MTFEETKELITSRRSVYPHNYIERPIDKELIFQLLELGNWAPTHRKTEPWRFKVFHSESSRLMLSNYLGESFLKANEGKEYPEIKYKKTVEKPMTSACVLAICMKRDEEVRIPEWEEIAAVACAVQNIWLGCTSLGIGSYWSTPSAIINATDFLQLEEGEKCMGLFYMGYKNEIAVLSTRNPVEEKTTFM